MILCKLTTCYQNVCLKPRRYSSRKFVKRWLTNSIAVGLGVSPVSRVRMTLNDSRLSKAIYYVELAKEKRLHGGQRLRFKVVVKRHLKATHIAVGVDT